MGVEDDQMLLAKRVPSACQTLSVEIKVQEEVAGELEDLLLAKNGLKVFPVGELVIDADDLLLGEGISSVPFNPQLGGCFSDRFQLEPRFAKLPNEEELNEVVKC